MSVSRRGRYPGRRKQRKTADLWPSFFLSCHGLRAYFVCRHAVLIIRTLPTTVAGENICILWSVARLLGRGLLAISCVHNYRPTFLILSTSYRRGAENQFIDHTRR